MPEAIRDENTGVTAKVDPKGKLRVALYDSDSNVISSIEDEAGNYHLGTGIIQDVGVDTNNTQSTADYVLNSGKSSFMD